MTIDNDYAGEDVNFCDGDEDGDYDDDGEDVEPDDDDDGGEYVLIYMFSFPGILAKQHLKPQRDDLKTDRHWVVCHVRQSS